MSDDDDQEVDVEAIARIADAFEASWKAGGRPSIEEGLTGLTGATRQGALIELVCLDYEYRQRCGEVCQVEDYAGEFPELADKLGNLRSEIVSFADRIARRSPVPSDLDETIDELPRNPISCEVTPEFPTIPGVKVLAELGRGGMGRVHLAFEPSLQREVAVKTMLPHHCRPHFDQLFMNEARSAASLDHPNIVKLFRFDPDHNPPYFIMQYVRGTPLDRYCIPGNYHELADILHQVCRALAHAHSLGVIHRDIKPSNILCTDKGYPFITDFGLAVRSSQPDSRESQLSFAGTPPYMAPELLNGSGSVNPQTDIYAVGVTLYRLLAGRLPYTDRIIDGSTSASDYQPPLPCDVCASVPEGLQRICLKAIEANPANRYQSVEQLISDLDGYLHNGIVTALPTRYRQELATMTESHLTDIDDMARRKIISTSVRNGLRMPYFEISEGFSPWLEESQYRWATLFMRIGSSLLAGGATAAGFRYSSQLGSVSRPLAVLIPLIICAVASRWLKQHHDDKFGRLFLLIAILLVPTFVLVTMGEYGLCRQAGSPSAEVFWQPEHGDLDDRTNSAKVFTELLAGTLPSVHNATQSSPTNWQMFIASATLLGCALWQVFFRQAVWISPLANIATMVAVTAALLVLGMREWIIDGRIALVASIYTGVAIAVLVASCVVDARTHSESVAGRFLYGLWPTPLVAGLTAIAWTVPYEVTGRNYSDIDLSDTVPNILCMLNGFLLIIFIIHASRRDSIVAWSEWFARASALSILLPGHLLMLEWETTVHIGNAEFCLGTLVCAAAGMGVLFIGTWIESSILVRAAMVSIGILLYRIGMRHFAGLFSWPVALMGVGLVISLLAMRSYKRAKEQEPPISPTGI